MKMSYSYAFMALVLCLFLFWPQPSKADQEPGLSQGQIIYVPAYSHIYTGDREKPFLLTVTLSIRNIDPKSPIRISVVDYYETQGKLLKRFIDQHVTLNTLESLRYIISEKDRSGGSGANFMVEWKSEVPVNPPIVETIMIGTQFGQGISFASRGRVIKPH